MKKLLSITIAITGAACASAQAVSAPSYLEMADSANYYIARERWDDASRCIRTALKMEPGNVGNVMLFSNLGLATGMAGKFGESMECFDIALGRAPRSIPVLTAKAKVLVNAGDTEGAKESLDTILELDSVSEWPLQTRGLLALRDRDYRGAAGYFSLITKSYPSNSWGPAGMAKCMEAQGHHSEAAGYYRDAISRTASTDEDRVEFQLGLMENLGLTDQIQEGLDVAKEALEAHPHDGRLYLLRGWLRKKLYLNSEAKKDKKLALDYGVDLQTVELYLPEEGMKR